MNPGMEKEGDCINVCSFADYICDGEKMIELIVWGRAMDL